MTIPENLDALLPPRIDRRREVLGLVHWVLKQAAIQSDAICVKQTQL